MKKNKNFIIVLMIAVVSVLSFSITSATEVVLLDIDFDGDNLDDYFDFYTSGTGCLQANSYIYGNYLYPNSGQCSLRKERESFSRDPNTFKSFKTETGFIDENGTIGTYSRLPMIIIENDNIVGVKGYIQVGLQTSDPTNRITIYCNDNVGYSITFNYTGGIFQTFTSDFNFETDVYNATINGISKSLDFTGTACEIDLEHGDYIDAVNVNMYRKNPKIDYIVYSGIEDDMNLPYIRNYLLNDHFNNSNFVIDGWSANAVCLEGTYNGYSVLKYNGGTCTTSHSLSSSFNASEDLIFDLGMVNYGTNANTFKFLENATNYINTYFNKDASTFDVIGYGRFSVISSSPISYNWTSSLTYVKTIYNKDDGTLKFYINDELVKTISSSLLLDFDINTITLQSANNGAVYDSLKIYQDIYYTCSDGIDNDDDGLIDINDEDCIIYTDSEDTYQSMECNDNIDNDNDGFIDYPDDSSCVGNFDDSEDPSTGSTCETSVCTESEKCIFYFDKACNEPITSYGFEIEPMWLEGFVNAEKYNTFDVINLNKYLGYGIIYESQPITTDYMKIRNTFDKKKDYQLVNSRAVFFFEDSKLRNGIKDESIDYILYNGAYSEDYKLAHIRLYPKTTTSSNIDIDIYNVNTENNETFLGTAKTNSNYIFGRFELNVEMDTHSQKFDLLWKGSDGAGAVNDLDYLIYTFNYPDRVEIRSEGDPSKYSSTYTSEINMYLSTLHINGKSTGEETFCTNWESPYALQEEFMGMITDCGWSANKDLFFNNKMEIGQDLEIYEAYKDFAPIENEKTRYYTTDFIFSAEDFAGTKGYVLVEGYGSLQEKNFALYFSKSDDNMIEIGYFTNGNFVPVTTYPFSSGLRIKVIMDMSGNSFNLLVNSEDLYSGLNIPNKLQDPSDISRIKIFSYLSDFTIDTLGIYPSDSGGNLLGSGFGSSSEMIDPYPEWAGDVMCGYFQSGDIPVKYCVQDSDCETKECSPSGRCQRFDYTYCDDNGKKRDTMCIASSMLSCGLETAKDGILDNFVLFLVFVIIMIIAIYIIIMTRGK